MLSILDQAEVIVHSTRNTSFTQNQIPSKTFNNLFCLIFSSISLAMFFHEFIGRIVEFFILFSI